jgi:GNAT superfamily N-acetyltransferase
LIHPAGQFTVRRLGPPDAPALAGLRRQALESAPLAFSSSPEDDHQRLLDFLCESHRASEQAVFGAFVEDLEGMVGIYRDGHAKAAHRCEVWGLFVKPVCRRQGVARALMAEAIAFARSLPDVTHVYVSVTAAAPEAVALYGSLGFATWGVDAASLCVAGRFVAERHMVPTLASSV